MHRYVDCVFIIIIKFLFPVLWTHLEFGHLCVYSFAIHNWTKIEAIPSGKWVRSHAVRHLVL